MNLNKNGTVIFDDQKPSKWSMVMIVICGKYTFIISDTYCDHYDRGGVDNHGTTHRTKQLKPRSCEHNLLWYNHILYTDLCKHYNLFFMGTTTIFIT